MTADRLPDDIERDLTLAHADTCDCPYTRNPVGKACKEVRDILRRAILAGILEREARTWNTASGFRTANVSFSDQADELRARAKALREGR